MLNTIRRRHGLRWQRDIPSLAELGFTAGNLLRIVFILLCLGLVGSMDYADEQRTAAETAQADAALQQAALLACLNSGAPGLYTIDDQGTRHYIVCGQPYTVSDENTRPTRRTM